MPLPKKLLVGGQQDYPGANGDMGNGRRGSTSSLEPKKVMANRCISGSGSRSNSLSVQVSDGGKVGIRSFWHGFSGTRSQIKQREVSVD